MFEPLRRPHVTAARPPGPAGVPVLGSLLEARRDPLHFLLNVTRTYGDISYYRIAIYTGYLLNHPDYIQSVLQTKHRNYSKDNYNYKMLKPVLGEGLLTSTGDHWLHKRRVIQPVLHRERIARFGSVTTRATLELLNQWDYAASRGQPIDVGTEMMRLTLRVIGEALFSIDVSADADTVGTAFALLNEDVAHRFKTVFVPPLWMPTRRNRAFRRACAELDRVVYGIIARRRQDGPGDDLLGVLLAVRDEASDEGMTDQQVRDELMTLLLAGHETTATLLIWTWYLLSKHPVAALKLQTELEAVLGGYVPTVADLPALKYTKMVLQESMRLYPPVWILSRTTVEDDEIGGYPIPAGSIVTLSPYAMHRHPDFWENPAGFDPERFMPERNEGRHRYAYFPFGGGPRYCIGSNLAMVEAQLILATVAQRYRLDLVPGHPVEPEPLVTLRPRHGLQQHPKRLNHASAS